MFYDFNLIANRIIAFLKFLLLFSLQIFSKITKQQNFIYFVHNHVKLSSNSSSLSTIIKIKAITPIL